MKDYCLLQYLYHIYFLKNLNAHIKRTHAHIYTHTYEKIIMFEALENQITFIKFSLWREIFMQLQICQKICH